MKRIDRSRVRTRLSLLSAAIGSVLVVLACEKAVPFITACASPGCSIELYTCEYVYDSLMCFDGEMETRDCTCDDPNKHSTMTARNRGTGDGCNVEE